MRPLLIGVLLVVILSGRHHAVAPEPSSCATHETTHLLAVKRAAKSVSISSGQERAWLRVLAISAAIFGQNILFSALNLIDVVP